MEVLHVALRRGVAVTIAGIVRRGRGDGRREDRDADDARDGDDPGGGAHGVTVPEAESPSDAPGYHPCFCAGRRAQMIR